MHGARSSCAAANQGPVQKSLLRCPPEAVRHTAQAISKVGRERRRRWLNDKILRDMAGAMTAAGADPNRILSNLHAPSCAISIL